MTPKRQTVIGWALIIMGLVVVGLQLWSHSRSSLYALLAVVLGSIGGQQIGQAHARSKR